ncbi:AhpC/TSA family protein [Neobacillus niacini]|jgi:AhpC/TSA antioxidant enzyme|nr:AhpC/TSA family protein [Neobacillus niacini]
MLTQLRKRYDEITATGFQIIIITPSTGSYLEQFVDAFGPYPYSLYGDPKRELYNSMGHQTMKKWKLLAKAGKGLLKGGTKAFMPEDPEQKALVQKAMKTHDIYIQGGTWLFDEKGNILWNHIDTAPEDHATIDNILAEINKL